jgi:branched-chain amino acid transport system substrate-binding protein
VVGSLGPALAALLTVAAACGGAGAAQVPVGSDVIVGAAISLSGSLAQEGQLTEQGYQMWLTWANAQGGVLVGGVRHHVQLLVQDDHSSPAAAAQLAAAMVASSGVQFLLGPYGSDTTATVAKVAEQDRIPLVDGTGAAQSIFNQGDHYTFGIMNLTDRYFAGLLDMAAGLNPRPLTVALLYADDSFSQEVADGVRAQVPGHGMTIVFSKGYPAGSTDVSGLVAAAAASKPDILINSGHLQEAVAIHHAARSLNLNAKIFAYSVGPSTPEFIADLGPDADYVFTGAQWTPQVKATPQMYLSTADYIATYRSMFRTLDEPSYQTAQGTAAGLALQRAMEDAGSLDPQAVRNALAALNVSTFYGVLRFDSRGANVYKQMVVQQIQQSRHHTVYPASEADARIVYPTPPWSQRP